MHADCTATYLLNNDSLDCHLTNGHAGPHKGHAVDGDYWWQKEPTRTRHE